uniref:Uncharacterized protein n=1 Tax=Trichinella nativa TaxID=6335 RepID=A0A0V1IT28_9BILA
MRTEIKDMKYSPGDHDCVSVEKNVIWRAKTI